MSKTIALITVIQSEEDACFFLSHVLPQLAQGMSNRFNASQYTWLLNTDAKQLTSISEKLTGLFPGITVRFIKTDFRNCTHTVDDEQCWIALTREALEVSDHIFIVRPEFNYPTSLIEAMPTYLDSGKPYLFLPVVPYNSRTYPGWNDNWTALYLSRLSQSTPFWRSFTEHGLLGFKLSANCVLIKNPYLATFYLNKSKVINNTRFPRILTTPYDFVSAENAFKHYAEHRHTDIVFTTRPRHAQLNALHKWIQSQAGQASLQLDRFISALSEELPNLKRSEIAHFCTDSLLCQRRHKVEPVPRHKVHEISFLTQLLLLRAHQGSCSIRHPETKFTFSFTEGHTITLPCSLHEAPIRVAKESTQPIIEQLNLKNFEQGFGLHMQSKIHQLILEKLHNYIPQLKRRLVDCAHLNIVIYGAGNHTSILLNVWDALEGPPLKCIMTSTPPESASVEGLPVYCIDDMKNERIDLIILSSASHSEKWHERVKSTSHSVKY